MFPSSAGIMLGRGKAGTIGGLPPGRGLVPSRRREGLDRSDPALSSAALGALLDLNSAARFRLLAFSRRESVSASPVNALAAGFSLRLSPPEQESGAFASARSDDRARPGRKWIRHGRGL